jgi:hypothetical protein
MFTPLLMMVMMMMQAPMHDALTGFKGAEHADEKLRKLAVDYHNLHPDWVASTIVDMLIQHHGMPIPQSKTVKKGVHALVKKVQRWLREYKAKGTHMSARQELSAKVQQKKAEAEQESLRIGRQRGTSGMSAAERRFMCELVLANPEVKTSQIQFKLHNQFGNTWALSTIRQNRKHMGFNCKRTSPYNRAADPVLRNQYKLLFYARALQPWQLVFMDETHKAGKDFFQRCGFARGSDRAEIVMNGPITRQFSVLAAMVRPTSTTRSAVRSQHCHSHACVLHRRLMVWQAGMSQSSRAQHRPLGSSRRWTR